MDKFENDLFQTVDSILLLLGHKPSVRHKPIKEPSVIKEVQPEAEVKEQIQLKAHALSTSKKGARLVKSPSELSKLLDKM